MGKTYSLIINDIEAQLTALDISAEDVVARLAKNGGKVAPDLFVFGEDHREFSITEKVTGIIQANKDAFRKFHVEYAVEKQGKFDHYLKIKPDANSDLEKKEGLSPEMRHYLEEVRDVALKAEARQLAELVKLSGHAPDESEVELFKKFNDSQTKLYQAVKDNGLGFNCYDVPASVDGKILAERRELADEIILLHVKKHVFSKLMYENGSCRNLEEISDGEFFQKLDQAENELAKDLKAESGWLKVFLPTRVEAQASYNSFCGELDIRPRGASSPAVKSINSENEFRLAAMEKILVKGAQKEEVLCRLMSVRNPLMAANIIESATQSGGQGKDELVVVGKRHFITSDKRDGSMVDDLKKLAAASGKDMRVITFDVVPVGRGVMEKMGGVFLGGRCGSDFTIFVEAEIVEEAVEEVKEISFQKSRNVDSQYKNFIDGGGKMEEALQQYRSYEQSRDGAKEALAPAQVKQVGYRQNALELLEF